MINIDVALPKSKSKVHFVPLIYTTLYLKKKRLSVRKS
ncbi:hypothetical protein X925_05250 [Petrotoga sp. 9T1HF07.CasAA.8.2]|nr:hypothetical protein X925_05250 [Petrotoga sp. 9T1HF07.CasAA.8.2]